MAPTGFEDKVSLVWGVAGELRGDFKAHEFGQIILPFLVLRRLECALAPDLAPQHHPRFESDASNTYESAPA